MRLVLLLFLYYNMGSSVSQKVFFNICSGESASVLDTRKQYVSYETQQFLHKTAKAPSQSTTKTQQDKKS